MFSDVFFSIYIDILFKIWQKMAIQGTFYIFFIGNRSIFQHFYGFLPNFRHFLPFFERKTCDTCFHCSVAEFFHTNLHLGTSFIHVQMNKCDFYGILCVYFLLFCDILNSQDLEESFESNRDGSNSEGSSSGSDR